MKTTILALLLTLTAAGACDGGAGAPRIEIVPAPTIVAGTTSHLQVPASCPVYVTGSATGDDLLKSPFPAHIPIICAVDDTGGTYGLLDGEASAAMAVVPGGHEIGYYIGFDATAGFTPDRAILDGPAWFAAPGDPSLIAYAAPKNILSPTDCCAESVPQGRLAPQTVAVGDQGWLISLGFFDTTPTQVAVIFDTDALLPDPANLGFTFWTRFYVNGAP
ncbi:MAG TPA: hypothetical protein VKZ18_12240 [Polyangia bacterium]|nr:hypothetical protein [Polyangia bacterium]